MVFAVVTGGGTSGHVIPARAILEALTEAGYSSDELAYVGTSRGIETELMKDFEVQRAFLPISGLQRSLTLRNVLRNAALPWRLVRSRLMARTLIKHWKPRVVVSVGGYASEPISRAAIAHNVPLVCVSYDRIAGLATRRQAKHATVCATAFSGSSLPRAVVTGAPVRTEFKHLNVQERKQLARQHFGVSQDSVMVSVVGGSLGSGALNSLVTELLPELVSVEKSVSVYHVCGNRFLNEPLPDVPNGVQYQRVGYESRMADLYSATDLLIARAGASTVAEIATVGIASVLVPWSGATDAHQDSNAAWLKDAGATVVVTDQQCASGEAIKVIIPIIDSEPARARLAGAAHAMGEIHRGNALVQVIQNAAL